ncbi:conserved Plasmodium protein, unknown function [Plasmodium knowlesi strain H]|uniref:Uncharacterized protein n=3 Tax=Plasmodium knowlesi TaxID=5850 RepID=A0A5K1VM23_PLAKH|nr:conserved Plasmodium protein, unknown function [Plasmodium knowlesi strain H]OTN65370.1 Uncharacterized protein PKNOH_S110081600 [Plasmodium knowlesi]CAA9989438.1 conserved Plasmodium protein, unknown function [Plasmodium knowlesi strain H]SBO25064.1 conserved Plasmodium protein, unknown function [Plasmodium knowlesi strain H]SBO27835.1 conserved Plasmodium protein, unknown function [Plasmodium knowlesi strain H]VVS78912.1 conserved Plasmodium protein, unknown function [Plasmodium knowlesi |eukprot:XP_002260164.1 hypothetical protein, conserved in Plasmodium species [Plasmodium knowlesi strain H]
MNYQECLHKFVNAHSDNFRQSFYAVVESSQIECLECPIEKTSTDNFLIKIYINNIIHNIRTFLLTCLSGSVGNILHNTEVDKQESCCYIAPDDEGASRDGERGSTEDTGQSGQLEEGNRNGEIKVKQCSNKQEDFLRKCKKVHNLRKSLENAHVRTGDTFGFRDDILRYYI